MILQQCSFICAVVIYISSTYMMNTYISMIQYLNSYFKESYDFFKKNTVFASMKMCYLDLSPQENCCDGRG